MAEKRGAENGRKDHGASSSGSRGARQRTCGTMQQHYYLLETNPAFRANQVALEHATQARHRMAAVARATPYKITVVVHVVHDPALARGEDLRGSGPKSDRVAQARLPRSDTDKNKHGSGT